jgi:hypothetical protein
MRVQLSLQACIVATVTLLSVLPGRDARCQLQTASSNVGYIDDAIVQTRLRLRFDAAYDSDRPDRAEFFYAKCGCFRDGGLDPHAPGPPELETRIDYQDISLLFEYAFDKRLSAFIESPFRFLDPEQNANTSGFADLQAGIKWALIANQCDYLTFQLKTYAPTGDAGRGLGTDHASLEPALLYWGRMGKRTTVEAEIRDWIPLSSSSGAGTGFNDDFAGNVIRYGVGFAYDIFNCADCGKRVAPVVEVVGWTVLDGLASGSNDGVTPIIEDASGDTIVNLKVGIRMASSRHDSFYVGYGRALTGDVWYEDIARAEYRWTF